MSYVHIPSSLKSVFDEEHFGEGPFMPTFYMSRCRGMVTNGIGETVYEGVSASEFAELLNFAWNAVKNDKD